MTRGPAVSIALSVAALATWAAHAASPSGTLLERIDVKTSSDRVELVLATTSTPTFQSFLRGDPATLVVDLLDTDAKPQTIARPGGPVEEVLVTRIAGRTGPATRLSIKLTRIVDYDVTAQGKVVRITLGEGGIVASDKSAFVDVGAAVKSADSSRGARVALRTDPAAKASSDAGILDGSVGKSTSLAQAAPATAGARQMQFIGFRNSAKESRVYARLNDGAEFAVRKEGDNLIVLEIQGAVIPLRNNKNHLDATFFDSPVKMITPSEIDDATPSIRITIEMKEQVPYEAKLEGREIAVVFKKG